MTPFKHNHALHHSVHAKFRLRPLRRRLREIERLSEYLQGTKYNEPVLFCFASLGNFYRTRGTHIVQPANDGVKHEAEESGSINKDADSDKHLQHFSQHLRFQLLVERKKRKKNNQLTQYYQSINNKIGHISLANMTSYLWTCHCQVGTRVWSGRSGEFDILTEYEYKEWLS